MQLHGNKQILVIEHQSFWRELSMHTLRDAGFSVEGFSIYHDHSLWQANPDLIILSCARVGFEEQQLITQLLREKHHLLTLSAYLPKSTMHVLFMQYADVIMDKLYSPNSLVNILLEVFNTVTQHEVTAFAE